MPIHLHTDHTHAETTPTAKNPQSMLKVLLAAGIIVIAGMFLFGSYGSAGARLETVAGTVKMYSQDGEWVEAKEGQAFKAGDKVRTADGSRAFINVGRGSALRLGANTQVEIEAMGRGEFRVRNLGGRVYNRVAKEDKLTWQVKSQDTTVTALGTAFAVASDETSKRVSVDVIESSVKLLVVKEDGTLETEAPAGTYLAVQLTKPVLESIAKAEIKPADAKKDPFLKWNFEADQAEGDELGAFALEEAPAPVAATTIDVPEPVIEEDVVEPPTPEPVVAPAPKPVVAVPAIKLSGKTGDKGVNLTWTLAGGLTAPHGFKVVESTQKNPSYPGNDAKLLASSDVRSYTWELKDGLTHHFRICAYNGNGACGTYSNDVEVKAPIKTTVNEGAFKAITGELALTATRNEEGVSLRWTKRTSSTFQGYKLVRSMEDPNLYYPKSGYMKFMEDRNATAFLDTGAPPAEKTVYYRICSLEKDSIPACGNVVTLK